MMTTAHEPSWWVNGDGPECPFCNYVHAHDLPIECREWGDLQGGKFRCKGCARMFHVQVSIEKTWISSKPEVPK